MKIARENIALAHNDCGTAVAGSNSQLDIITFEDPGGTLTFQLKAGPGDDDGDLNTGMTDGPLLIMKPNNTFINISGNSVTPILNIDGTTVEIEGINLTNGKGSTCNAIDSTGTLTLDSVQLYGNGFHELLRRAQHSLL